MHEFSVKSQISYRIFLLYVNTYFLLYSPKMTINVAETCSWSYLLQYLLCQGTAVAQWLRCCATNQKVAGSIPAGVNGFFIDIKSFRSHYSPGVDSASNRNEYQEYFLGVKSGRCVRLTTLPPSCAVVTKSGKLNFLEPSGPVQACNGTALPFCYVKRLFVGCIAVLFLTQFKYELAISYTCTKSGCALKIACTGFQIQYIINNSPKNILCSLWHLQESTDTNWPRTSVLACNGEKFSTCYSINIFRS